MLAFEKPGFKVRARTFWSDWGREVSLIGLTHFDGSVPTALIFMHQSVHDNTDWPLAWWSHPCHQCLSLFEPSVRAIWLQLLRSSLKFLSHNQWNLIPNIVISSDFAIGNLICKMICCLSCTHCCDMNYVGTIYEIIWVSMDIFICRWTYLNIINHQITHQSFQPSSGEDEVVASQPVVVAVWREEVVFGYRVINR